ncbi:MAG: hypothetical protein HRT72_14080 [Flavobacteriales bacterium]|nr:hypothetical protein [Flavobacteriales bacterium]
MLNVEKLIPFLIDLELTANEFMLLHLKYLGKKALLRQYKQKFAKENANILTVKFKDKACKLGYIARDETREGYFIYFTDKWKDLYVDEWNAGNALWDLYPGFIKIKGGTAPLTNTDKADWRSLYYRTIEGLKGEHEQIMLDTAYGIEHGMIRVKITAYVRSEAWSKIRPLRLEGLQVTDKSSSPVQTQNDDHEF